ncbi:MAG: hypothetical protein HY645_03025 [Acidobacteria bacterium]|nr:hypothetical protein [Acidobacteriota bacterium]
MKHTGNELAPAWPRASGAFQTEFIDFNRGIRVGRLEANQRITQILKTALEARYSEPFVIDRWGRGVFWQWICFVPRSNRMVKKISSGANFSSSKFFIGLDKEERCFQSGLQVERGFIEAPKEYPYCQLRGDWDWHRLLRGLKTDASFHVLLQRLVKQEGFCIRAGGWEKLKRFSRNHSFSARQLVSALCAPPQEWGCFQLYFPVSESEVRTCSGWEMVEAILAVFQEVLPVMNRCMEVELA